MPVLTRAVSELTNHIFMPVVTQLAHRILDSLEYSDVVGDQIYINSDWSTHSITSDHNDNANLGQTRFSVEVNVQLNPTSQKWDMYTFHHTTAYGVDARINYNEPIYLDIPNQVKMLEMVSPVSFVLNCELILKSSELAFQTPQQIFNAHENGSIFHFNDLFFDYPLPKPIVSVLLQIWEMDRVYGKEAGIDFVTYIKQRSNGGWNIAKHRDLDEYEIVIPVYDLKTLCVLEYSEDRPQGVMEDKLPVAWSIPFIFTVQFGMPTLNILKYPCIINNQLLPSTCIPVDKNVRHNTLPEYHHGKQDEDYDKMKKVRPAPSYIQVPWYDDWIIPYAKYVSAKHIPFLVLDLLVEEDKELNEIDLKEDFDTTYCLTPLTKEFLYQEGIYTTDIHSPFHMTMFRDDKELTPDVDFVVTDDLILRFKAINKVSRYRVVMTVFTDIQQVNPTWFPLLFKYYKHLGCIAKDSLKSRILNGDMATDIREIIRQSKTGKQLIDDKKSLTEHPEFCLGYNSNIHNFIFFIDEDGYIYDQFKHKLFHISNYSPIIINSTGAHIKTASILSRTSSEFELPIYINVNSYGGDKDDQSSSTKDTATKSNVGRVPTPYPDRGVTANAYNTDARIFDTTIIARKTTES